MDYSFLLLQLGNVLNNRNEIRIYPGAHQIMTIHTLFSFHPSKKMAIFSLSLLPQLERALWKCKAGHQLQTALLCRHHLFFLPVRITSVFLIKVPHNHLGPHPLLNKSAWGCRHIHTEILAEQGTVVVLLVACSTGTGCPAAITLAQISVEARQGNDRDH